VVAPAAHQRHERRDCTLPACRRLLPHLQGVRTAIEPRPIFVYVEYHKKDTEDVQRKMTAGALR
jgi:hypothetical protein